MTPKNRKILCVFLTLIMLIPLCSAFTVSTGAVVVNYATAATGDLLYTANFNGDDAWSPDKTSWGNLSASVINGGAGAKFSPNSAYKNGWGGEVTGLPIAGKAYTIVFTATSLYNEGQHIGLSLNGGGYVLVTPGRDRYALGWYNSYQNKQNFASYDYSVEGNKTGTPITYAIEVAADENGDATLYKVYVKDGNAWSLIYTMSDFSEFNWSADSNLSLVFVKYLAGSTGTNAVDSYNQKRTNSASVENVRVYKGNVAANGNYYFPQNGEKIIDVKFSTAEDNTSLFKNDKNQGTVTVSEDGKTATLNPTGGMIWGDLMDCELPAGNGEKYTIFFHTDFSTGEGIWFGIYPDAYSGIPMKDGGNARPQHSTSKETDGNNWRNKSDYGADVRDFAIEIDTGTNAQTLYAKNKNGTYTAVLSYSNFANTFSGDSLSCSLMAYCTTANSYVTFSNVSIYKGFAVDVYDRTAVGMPYYESLAEGAVIKTVNFKEEGWNPGFASDSNKGADVAIAEDGTGVTFTIHEGDNYRAMWGAPLTGEKFPLAEDVKYTFLFDLTLGADNAGFAFYADNCNGLVISGDGTARWWSWNDRCNTGKQKWTDCTDVVKTDKQTFAVVMDYAAETYTLYVKRSNGSFAYVTTVHGSWDEVADVRGRFYARDIGTYDSDTKKYSYVGGSDYTIKVENFSIIKGDCYADRYVLETVTGASVRLSDPTGIRFSGLIGKDYLNSLKTTYGEANVKIGMFITPTDYLTGNSLAFTKEALDACNVIDEGKKYVKIEAATILESGDGNAYLINCALTSVNPANYTRDFSAITYVEINGNTYYYSKYVEADHSRSVAYVANMALTDVNDKNEGEYSNAVAEATGYYSPYTAAERTILSGFSGSSTLSVMSYNLEMYRSSGGWEGRDPSKAIETVQSNSPDIVGLQEVSSEWGSYLTPLTSNGYTRVQGNTSGGSHTPDLYYKTAKFNNLSSGSLFYKDLATSLSVPNTEDADMSLDKSGSKGRMFTYALLEEKTSGKKILAINTHLHYGGTGSGHEEDDKVRRYEIAILIAWINAFEQNYDCVVVTGDMNSHYLSGQGKTNMQVYKDAGFGLTCETAALKGDVGGTLDVNGYIDRQEWIFDYVLTKGNAKAVSYTVVDNKIDNGKYPSDHLPVLAKVFCY